MAIASRQERAGVNLLPRLKIELDDLFGQTLRGHPAELSHVQAMVLCSVWPLPNLRPWNDNSLALINLAMPYAMQLGLHRPGHRNDFRKLGFFNRKDVLQVDQAAGQEPGHERVPGFEPSTVSFGGEERISDVYVRTWVALVATHSSLNNEWGHLPLISLEDLSIKTALHLPDLPAELRDYASIQRFSQSVTRQINDLGSIGFLQSEGFYSLMDRLEQNFEAIRTMLARGLSWMTRLRVQAAHLYLRVLYFLDDGSSEKRTAGILGAYSVAFALISDLIIGDESSYDLLPYAPLSAARWIFCAALVLFRVCCSSLGSRVDKAAAKVAYNAAAFAIRKLSVLENNAEDLIRIPTRLADILRALWRRGEEDDRLCSEEPRLKVLSRLGNNMQADCMRLLYNYRMGELGRAKQAGQSRPSATATSAPITYLQSQAQHMDLPLWERPSHLSPNGDTLSPPLSAASDVLLHAGDGPILDFFNVFDPFGDKTWWDDAVGLNLTF
ncbi:MAG: hypothetical protein M1822_009409 [Bathelium mastoideum]|nr:MAG: hypothetical protein M1822_009409 [Bathelium mastoideum]